MPNDLLARCKRAVTDLRGSLNRDPGRSREILRELLGEIRLQAVGDEIYAEFETRPERIFLSERVAFNCGCGDLQPDLEAPTNQVIASSVSVAARLGRNGSYDEIAKSCPRCGAPVVRIRASLDRPFAKSVHARPPLSLQRVLVRMGREFAIEGPKSRRPPT